MEIAALSAVKASNPRDEVTVINFNDEAFHDSEFTNGIPKMEEGLTKIDSRGGTAMRDTVNTTIDFVKKKGKHDEGALRDHGRKRSASTQITLEKLVQKTHNTEVLHVFHRSANRRR